jgi:hypothetical protein
MTYMLEVSYLQYYNTKRQALAGSSTIRGGPELIPPCGYTVLFHPPAYRTLCWYIRGELVSISAISRVSASCCRRRMEALSRRRRNQIAIPSIRAARGTPKPMATFASDGSPLLLCAGGLATCCPESSSQAPRPAEQH